MKIGFRAGLLSLLTLFVGTSFAAPTAPSISITQGTYTNSVNISVTDSAIGATNMRFSVTGGSTWAAWIPYNTSAFLTLEVGDGLKTVVVEFENGDADCGLGTIQSCDTPVTAQDTITLDTVAPSASVTAPAVSTYTNGTSTFSFSSSDATSGVATREGSANGATFVATTTGSAFSTLGGWAGVGEGAFTMSIRVTDNSGLQTTVTRSFNKDTTGPTGSLASLAGTTTNDDTPTLNLTVADTGVGTVGAQMSFSCDNATWGSWVGYAASYASFDVNSGTNGCAVADGPRTVYVRFRDSLQNVGISYNTGSFTLDTNAPVVTIDTPAVNAWTNGTQTFTYTATDNISVVSEEGQIGGAAFVVTTSGSAFSTVSGWGAAAEGLFTLSIRATDAAGNATTATRTFQKDTVAPVLTEVTPILGPEGGFYAANAPYTSDTTPEYEFDSSENGSGSTTINYAGGCSGPAGAVNNTNTIELNTLAEGQYTCTVAVTDVAGNTSSTLGINSTLPGPYTNWFVIDTTSPTIPQVVIRTIHTTPPVDPTGDLTYLNPFPDSDPNPDPNPGTPDYYAQQGDTIHVCFNEADNFLTNPTPVPLVQVNGQIMGRPGVFTYGPVTGPCFDEGFDWELALTGNGTDPEGLIAWVLSMNDQAGNNVAPVATTDGSIATYDRSVPVINDVRIYSVSDDDSAFLGDFPQMYGNDGDSFYLYFEVTDVITDILQDGNGEIIAHLFPGLPEETPLNFEYDAGNTRWQVSNNNQAGYVAVTADGSGNNYMVPNIVNWAEGQVTFQIRILDLAGNELTPPITQTSTTAFDNSTVIYDQTRPLLPNPANVVDLNGRATTRLKVRADAMISWTGASDPDTGLNDLTNISGHDSTATTTHDGNTAGIWKYKMMQTNNFDADDADSIVKGVAPYPYVIDYDQTHDHYDEIMAAHGGVFGFSRHAYGPTNPLDEPYREIHSGTDSEARALQCLNVGAASCTCAALQTHPGEQFHIYPQDANPNATSGSLPGAPDTGQDAIIGFDYLAQAGIGLLGSGSIIDYANPAYSAANLAYNRQRRDSVVNDFLGTGAASFDGRYTQLDPWVTYGPALIPPRENDLFNDRYFPYRFHMVVVDKAGNHSCGYRVVDDPATNPGGQFVEIDMSYCSSEDSTLGEGLGLDWRAMPIYEQPYTVGISGTVVNNLGEPVIGATVCAVSRDNRDDGPPPANIREFCDAPLETCCDVVDNNGNYGIPVNRDQYYNVTYYKPGFYFQKKDDNLIANQCGIYNDLVLHSILNIFDSVHEWNHILSQPVRIGTEAMFMVGDLPVRTYIDVWSLTGNIQVIQTPEEPNCATIQSIGRIYKVLTNNPDLTFTNLYGTDDIQSQVYSVTGAIDEEGDHRNALKVCGIGKVYFTGSQDGTEQFNGPFENITNGQNTAFSSGASRTGVNWIPSTGEAASYRSGRLRGTVGDINDLALDANSSEYYHELNNLSQEIPSSIKTCVNRNGFEYFCGYLSGRIGLDDYKYAASKRSVLAGSIEDLKSAYSGDGAERRQKTWNRWGKTPNMKLAHAKQKFESHESLVNGRPSRVQTIESYTLADSILNNRHRKYEQKQKPDIWERHPDIEFEESEIIKNDMLESMNRLKDFYERVWEERQAEAEKKENKYFFFQ